MTAPIPASLARLNAHLQGPFGGPDKSTARKPPSHAMISNSRTPTLPESCRGSCPCSESFVELLWSCSCPSHRHGYCHGYCHQGRCRAGSSFPPLLSIRTCLKNRIRRQPFHPACHVDRPTSSFHTLQCRCRCHFKTSQCSFSRGGGFDLSNS